MPFVYLKMRAQHSMTRLFIKVLFGRLFFAKNATIVSLKVISNIIGNHKCKEPYDFPGYFLKLLKREQQKLENTIRKSWFYPAFENS